MKRWQRLAEMQSGQAIVLIALAAVVLIAIAGLAIDGGRAYFLKRETQNAADAGAIAAARAMCEGRSDADVILAGQAAARVNGFDDTEDDQSVAISLNPGDLGFEVPEECRACYVSVNVGGDIPPTFISIVYGGALAADSQAVGVCNPNLNANMRDTSGLKAIWTAATACNNTLQFNGSTTVIHGGIHSNADIQSGGGGQAHENAVYGQSSYVTSLDIPDGKIDWFDGDGSGSDSGTLIGTCSSNCFPEINESEGANGECDGNPCQIAPIPNDPLGLNFDDYAPGGLKEAQYDSDDPATDRYFVFDDCKGGQGMDGDWLIARGHFFADPLDPSGEKMIIQPGIYYSECDIHLALNKVEGQATFIARGEMHFSGSYHNLSAFDDDLLAFALSQEKGKYSEAACNSKGVQFSGSYNHFNGNIYAPNGEVSFSGSSNETINQGCIVAYTTRISGSHNRINCTPSDADLEPEPAIWLAE